ncbi:phosphoribosylglycinamide formyltransferase 1 [Bathymodiolus japonicus methanotrophic gill symbiont]|uniref:formyltransferase family protein n=1 Tax=Bathymodiolus japonicus methanotrophic gill symbiont TaxID=113269 RepID=UPI001B68B07F|nr:formyltransferase family protein [Bathymodiolus japonicus methanotrophic gill symbiont]GFO70993.1 phosphoribosylglycinamide formyltransferase 1 [Bathymodiolus japonicus methanotrophic gill symbiont]
MKISFLASHGGSSARQIIAAIQTQKLTGFEIGLLITNNKNTAIYPWCLEHGIEVVHISGETHPDNEDRAIKQALLAVGTDIVVLSGYMKKIGCATLAAFNNKILNIHPSLLPRHGGHKMYGDFVHAAVLSAGDKESGASVQVINEVYDAGPVLLQKTVPVLEDDTIATLGARVRSVEAELYINALQKWQANNFKI